MSLTLGNDSFIPKPGAVTILVGGTFSASHEQAHRLFFPQPPVWPLLPWMDEIRIVPWKGGFPIKWFGFPVFDPRRKGVRDILALVADLWRRGYRKFALVGHSHGGTICIRAMAEMLDAVAWKDCEFRLVTIATPPLRDTHNAASRIDVVIENSTQSGRVDWLGVVDKADPVIPIAAGIIEKADHPGRVDFGFGCETAFVELTTPRSGPAAHDELPGSVECRDAIRAHYARPRTT